MLLVLVVTLLARYYWDGGRISHDSMAVVAQQAFLWIAAIHSISMFASATAGSLTIAGEKDRRTLGFLLATRLESSEIILGKLAACLVVSFTGFAAGLPVVLLLDPLGGIDPRMILLGYAGLASTVFFMVAMSIVISTIAPDGRGASGLTVLCVIGWIFLPFVVAIVFPHFGIRLPEYLKTLNSWAVDSSPLGLMLKFGAGGLPSATGFLRALAWMCELQLIGGAAMVALAIARLRPEYRSSAGGEVHTVASAGRWQSHPLWRLRLRPRPPVGDDPILWREIHTTRGGFFLRLVGVLIALGVFGALFYFTFFFGWRAFVELWHHGYGSSLTGSARPEFNLMVRFFFTDAGPNAPSDVARTEFNLYLRGITTPVVALLALMSIGVAGELIATEKAKETWNSLIATPLSVRDILTSKLLACLWRMAD